MNNHLLIVIIDYALFCQSVTLSCSLASSGNSMQQVGSHFVGNKWQRQDANPNTIANTSPGEAASVETTKNDNAWHKPKTIGTDVLRCLITFGFSSKKSTLVSIPARKKIKTSRQTVPIKTISGAQI